MQSGISDKRGVLSSNAGIAWNLEDVDFSDKELAQIRLQKGVLGLPKLLGCIHPVLPSTTDKNNNSGDNKTNGNKQHDVMVVDQEGGDTRKVRQSRRKWRQTNYTDNTMVGDSDDDLIVVEPQTLNTFKEGV